MLSLRAARRGCLVRAARGASAMASSHPKQAPYRLTPLPKLGAEVHGLDLKKPVSQDVVERIKEDVTRHRLLVFRDQGVISGERHVDISRWFGALESTFYKHPCSPHPDVFRVSNVASEGCTGVGRTGWHVDGSFQPQPFAYSLYHMVSVPRRGDTAFAPLHEIINALPPEQRARWERLSMASDRRGGSVKPLIYTHPRSGQDTLCFHLGMTETFVWDWGTPRAQVTTPTETRELLQEMDDVFRSSHAHLLYAHKWREGDFIFSDNAALGHEASPETQAPVEEVGLRIMHRTTVQGSTPPRKAYKIDEEGRRVAAAG